jgi:hypothetical protein
MEHMMLKLIATGRGEDVLKEMNHIFETSRSQHKKILIDNFIEVPDGATVWQRGQGNLEDEGGEDEDNEDDEEGGGDS